MSFISKNKILKKAAISTGVIFVLFFLTLIPATQAVTEIQTNPDSQVSAEAAPSESKGLVSCGRPQDIGTPNKDCTFCHFFGLFNNIIIWILKFVVSSLAVLLVVIGGFLLATSRGNPGQLQKGKDILIWTFAGLAVIFVGWAVLNSLLSGIGVVEWTGLVPKTVEVSAKEFIGGKPDKTDIILLNEEVKNYEFDDLLLKFEGGNIKKLREILFTQEPNIILTRDWGEIIQNGTNFKIDKGSWWQFSCGTKGALTVIDKKGYKTTQNQDSSNPIYVYVNGANWGNNQFVGSVVNMKTGMSAGERRVILGNEGHYLRIAGTLLYEEEDEFEILGIE